MSEPADSPAPRPEDAEPQGEAPSAPPQSAAPDEPPRPETPMGDSRPEDHPEPEPVPAQNEPAPVAAGVLVPPEHVPAQHATPPMPVDMRPRQAMHPQHPPVPPHYAPHPQAYYQGPPQMLPPNPRWHRPEAIPKPAVVVLAIAIALFGGWAAFHGEGVGIGFTLTGIAFVAVPLFAGDRKDLLPRLPGAVLVAALWSVATIRDAGWVVFLCTFAAFVLTPLVLAPQRRFSGTVVTLLMGWLEGLAESFRWAKRSRPGKDGRTGANMRNVWVAVITGGLLVVFGGLFAAADSTFAGLVLRLMPEVNPFDFFLRLLLAAVLFPLALLWIYTAVAKPSFDSQTAEGARRTVSRFELSVPLVALNLLFAAFIVVQLRVFIGGEAYVMKTAGLTFADYARRGFWQLSFVTALALGVIAVAAWLAPKRAKADRWAVRILLGSLCVLSMVVIASAMYRMYTYADTYGLTRMRVWIFTVEIWLAVLFAMVVVCCWKLRASWLPRAVLASGALALLGLAAANPDALIARYNIEHEHKLDIYYLQGLSDDAVPEFERLSGEDRTCLLARGWVEEPNLMAWNLGRQRAKDVLDGADADTSTMTCSYGYEDWDEEDYGAPAPEESYEPELAAAPPVVDFFETDTCDLLDASAAQYGLDASPSNTDAYVMDASPQEAWLNCGYFGDGDVRVEAKLTYFEYESDALDYLGVFLDSHMDGGWAITDLDDQSTSASLGSGGTRQYQYYSIDGNLIAYAYLAGEPSDTKALTIAEDLTGQLRERYEEVS